jgi:BsuBI/PstI restriction endonuclease HTH domain
MPLPPLLPWTEIRERLRSIFPEHIDNRGKMVGDAAAKTAFAALYTGAVEGADRWIAPRHVVWMGDTQAGIASDADRDTYLKSGRPMVDRWYKDNTREPIRDEVIRKGFVAVNAMVEKPGVAVT